MQEPYPKRHWVHLSCAYWMPTLEQDQEEPVVTGIQNTDIRRFRLACQICGQRKGACVQCPAKDCLKAYHPECARRYGAFMGYGYNTYPNWRIYCEDHAELPIKLKIKKLKDSTHNQLVKFCRALNRTADLNEDTTPTTWPKKVTFKRTTSKPSRERSKNLNPNEIERQNKLIDAFLSSFYSNINLNSSQQFSITLKRDPNGGFEVASIDIPPPDDQQTEEENPSLGKRKTKSPSPDPISLKVNPKNRKVKGC